MITIPRNAYYRVFEKRKMVKPAGIHRDLAIFYIAFLLQLI